jgi:uncharacterized membrane protein
MVEKIVKFIVGAFAGLTALPFGRQLIVFIISLMPVLELRGGLIAAALLKMDPVQSYIISIIGNVIPVPFILLFFDSILKWMRRCDISVFRAFTRWVDKRVEKNRGQIEKYGFWGLALFVGIPLPGTGAWTGCMIASVLHMDRRQAFKSVMIGILIASVIMMLVSFGVISNIIG